MKQRGDQTEIMLPRPCVITPTFNYVDIWQRLALIRQIFTKSYTFGLTDATKELLLFSDYLLHTVKIKLILSKMHLQSVPDFPEDKTVFRPTDNTRDLPRAETDAHDQLRPGLGDIRKPTWKIYRCVCVMAIHELTSKRPLGPSASTQQSLESNSNVLSAQGANRSRKVTTKLVSTSSIP